MKLAVKEIAEYLKYDIEAVQSLMDRGTISQQDGTLIIQFIKATKSERDSQSLAHT